RTLCCAPRGRCALPGPIPRLQDCIMRRKFASRLCFEELESRVALSTYYVATTGNDWASGASSAPWKTLQHAVDSGLHPGDTILVRGGIYAGFVMGWNTTPAGTASAPITIEGDPSAVAGSVIINARNPYTAVAVDLEPASDYITVENFSITS